MPWPSGDTVPFSGHALMELMELTETSEDDSPVSNVCSNGDQSISSDSHLMTALPHLEHHRISVSAPHHQQHVGFLPGEPDHHSAATQAGASSYHPDGCWSSRMWDQDHPLSGGSMDMGWDWDNMVLLQGKGDPGRGGSEWVIVEGDEVTGFAPGEPFHMGVQSASSKTPVDSYSSGIPGVAAVGKDKVEGDKIGVATLHWIKAEGEECQQKSLGQHVNDSSWIFHNNTFARGVEGSAVSEQQPNKYLKISDQQLLVGDQDSGSIETEKVMGFLGLGGGAVTVTKDMVKTEEKDTCSNGGTGSGDEFVGLKLGKRTYFGDTAAVSGGKSTLLAVTPAPCSSSAKRRSATATQTPRCQVEGCKMDLSTGKDYHRRHKVCAPHSKAAKVIVASIEQRFCQQCSRFHLLAEFDEGKRSCRKRLAGHNERRRKPQPPDSLALARCGVPSIRGEYGRSSGIFFDDHCLVHGFGDPHYLWQQLQHTAAPGSNDVNDKLNFLTGTYSRFENLGNQSTLNPQLQFSAGAETFLPCLSKPDADRLLMLLQQHPKTLSDNLENQRISQLQQESGIMGPALSLSTSSGKPLVGLEPSIQASHAFSGISDSDCALSLLSSQPWGSMTLNSGPMDFSAKPHPVVGRILAEMPTPPAKKFPHRASTEVGYGYYRATDEPLFIQPLSQKVDALRNPQARFAAVSDTNDLQILSVPRGLDNGALHNSSSHQRPTIDLMELPRLHHSHRPVQATERELSGFQSLRPFDLAMYGAHAYHN